MVSPDGNTIEPDDDLTSILGDGPIPFPTLEEREFLPWHKPRKQYIRNLQWVREIGFLARDLDLQHEEFRYLTLPGNDLLDVRHLHDRICEPRDLKLRYLGFNDAARPGDEDQSRLNSSEFSIKRLDYVHPESQVFPGDFRMVGDQRSVPWQRVRASGHFHAINLDLCGGFAGREKAEGIPNYFTALQWLLQNQSGSTHDFLLFITTRMDGDSIDADVKSKLDEVARRIYSTCETYAASFADAWGVDQERALDLVDVAGPTESFMLGLTQWIVARGVAVGLRSNVRSFMTYRTGDTAGDDDIVSLAIRFKPQPELRTDPQGLVRPLVDPIEPAQSECEQSADIPQKVSSRRRVDQILQAEADEFQRCLDESASLLSSAGYDEPAYRLWVDQQSGLAS